MNACFHHRVMRKWREGTVSIEKALYALTVNFGTTESGSSSLSDQMVLALDLSDEGLHQLDERLLALRRSLGSRCGWFGLWWRKQTAGWRWRRAAAEKAEQCWQQSTLEEEKEKYIITVGDCQAKSNNKQQPWKRMCLHLF